MWDDDDDDEDVEYWGNVFMMALVVCGIWIIARLCFLR